jgi:periplasmic divalent cation tolerance protein
MLIILSTVPSFDEGEDLARKIVDVKLAACVQILPKMTSVYFWEGKVQREAEHLLLIKTLPEKYDELEAFILENHSYEVPEIVSLNAENVGQKYLDWAHQVLSEA